MSIFSSCNANNQYEKNDRQPAVAGSFYPSNKSNLKTLVDSFFNEVNTTENNAIAVIVPHAGYVFSGPVAAAGIKCINNNKKYEHVFVIGSSHTHYFNGASIYTQGDFITPLGKVQVDPLSKTLVEKHKIFNNDINIHAQEHSIEVQLPFLQCWLKEPFSIVPIIIGGESIEISKNLADILKEYFNENNLFIISSDFSHYPDYNDAVYSDNELAKAILSKSVDKFFTTKRKLENSKIPELVTSACGWTSILTLLYIIEKNDDYELKKVCYKNSGDSPYGSKDRVVGYNSIIVLKKQNNTNNDLLLNEEDKKTLLNIARTTITEFVKNKQKYEVPNRLITKNITFPAGAFVTIKKNGELRGCIGSFQAEQPLYLTVRDMAIAASSYDYRFEPVTPDELNSLEIEISVLTPMRKISSIDEIELGKHGIYIKKGSQSGTFLPQVATATKWTKEEFLGHCARDKAFIGWDGWKNAEIYTYEAIVFDEKELMMKYNKE